MTQYACARTAELHGGDSSQQPKALTIFECQHMPQVANTLRAGPVVRHAESDRAGHLVTRYQRYCSDSVSSGTSLGTLALLILPGK
jgi:hypothetical protein